MHVLLFVTCLRRFLAFKLLFARTSPHTKHTVDIILHSQVVSKTKYQENCLIFSRPSFCLQYENHSLLVCGTACTDVSDRLTAFRLFYKPGIHIFMLSDFKLHTILMSTVSGDSDNEATMISNNLSFNMCIFSRLRKATNNHTTILTSALGSVSLENTICNC
jgi:hypothetical protein